MNKDELRGKIEHTRERIEARKREADKTLARISSVANGTQRDMKLVEFLKEETGRLESQISDRIVLEGEEQKLLEQYRNAPDQD